MYIKGFEVKEGVVDYVSFVKEWEGWETHYIYNYTLKSGEVLNSFQRENNPLYKEGATVYYYGDIKDGKVNVNFIDKSEILKHKEMEYENNNPQAKVLSIQGNGDWSNDHGTFYAFEVELEGVGTLKVNHKTQEPPYKIGEMVEYEITATTQKFGTKGKIKRVTDNPYKTPSSKPSNGYTPKTDNVQEMIVRQSALKAAVEVAVNRDEEFSPIQITGLAEYFFNYCISGNVVKYLPPLDGEAYTNDQVQEMMHEEEQKQKATESDDLPF